MGRILRHMRIAVNGVASAALIAALSLTPAWSDATGTTGHPKATGVPRDPHGKIKRSAEAKHEFRKSHPCPSTGKSSGSCPGYTIDHVTPLKRGGADSPSNMQWQTNEDAKRKDQWE